LYRGSPRQCEKNFNPYEFYIINVNEEKETTHI
jgi:hypothetical protein